MPDPLRIPTAPGWLTLAIERLWDGAHCRDSRQHGWIRLQSCAEGLDVEASLPHQRMQRIPDAASGTRVADLWEYDVVECFLVGAGGRYLEVELGAGGHFLVLTFAAPRELADAHEDLAPELCFQRDSEGWRSRVRIPSSVLPSELHALNAFAIVGGAHLAYQPLPGGSPDFHQPSRFPAARLEGCLGSDEAP